MTLDCGHSVVAVSAAVRAGGDSDGSGGCVSQRLNAWRRWQAAAGPWRGYCICPALTVLESTVSESTLSPPRPPSLPVPGRKGGDFLRLFKEHTAVVVDLDPLVGVELAAEASQRRLAHVVLVLPRWPHANAVLPCG